MASGQTGVTPVTPRGIHEVRLTDAQANTILSALKYDYINSKREFQALPVGTELCQDIEDAFRAVWTQTR